MTPPLRKILLIERLDWTSLPVWTWLALANGGGYFIGSSRRFRGKRIERWLMTWLGLRRLRYEEFPGSYFEVHRLVSTEVNDAFFDRSLPREAGGAVALLRRFQKHPRMEVALRRALEDAYTLERVKTFVFLRFLAQEGAEILLLPRDHRDPQPWIPPSLRETWRKATIPVWAKRLHPIRARAEAMAFLGYVTFLAVRLALDRGICLRTPPVQNWRFGFDLFNHGIDWRKPYHTSFLYDDRQLNPRQILHVVRDRLQDERTRRHWIEQGIPFVEAGRVPIPLPFLFHRVLGLFLGGCWRLGARELLKPRAGPFLWSAASVLFNGIQMELLETRHRIDLFIGRDEYTVGHILRRVVYDRRGGKTVGLCHGDDTSPTASNSYISYHRFCVPGSFHREMLQRAAHTADEIPVIGMGIYGLDVTHRHLQAGWIPEGYREYRGKFRILGACASSYQEDFFLTRRMTLEFYRSVFRLLDQHPDLLVVVRPKGEEFKDPEFRALLSQAGPRAVLEEQVWLYDLLPALDLVVCIACSTVGLEGVMAGKPVVYFEETGCYPHPYGEMDSRLVARSARELAQRVKEILTGRNIPDEETLDRIRSRHGLLFDGKVAERFRQVICGVSAQLRGKKEVLFCHSRESGNLDGKILASARMTFEVDT